LTRRIKLLFNFLFYLVLSLKHALPTLHRNLARACPTRLRLSRVAVSAMAKLETVSLSLALGAVGLGLLLGEALRLLVVVSSAISTRPSASLDVMAPLVAVEALDALVRSVLSRTALTTSSLAVGTMMATSALVAGHVSTRLPCGNSTVPLVRKRAQVSVAATVARVEEKFAILDPVSLGAGSLACRNASNLVGKATQVSANTAISMMKVAAVLHTAIVRLHGLARLLIRVLNLVGLGDHNLDHRLASAHLCVLLLPAGAPLVALDATHAIVQRVGNGSPLESQLVAGLAGNGLLGNGQARKSGLVVKAGNLNVRVRNRRRHVVDEKRSLVVSSVLICHLSNTLKHKFCRNKDKKLRWFKAHTKRQITTLRKQKK
jgi:hypothetical protein